MSMSSKICQARNHLFFLEGREDLPEEGVQDGQERPQAVEEGPAQARQVYRHRGSGLYNMYCTVHKSYYPQT